jgi:hypothetical protein
MNPNELLLQAPRDKRAAALMRMDREKLLALRTVFNEGVDPRWLPYRNDPVRFVTDGLGESVWSKQVEILNSVRDNKRTPFQRATPPGSRTLRRGLSHGGCPYTPPTKYVW